MTPDRKIKGSYPAGQKIGPPSLHLARAKGIKTMNPLYDPLVGRKDNEYRALSLAIQAGVTNALATPPSTGDQPKGSWPAIVDLIFDIVRHRDRLALKRKALGRRKRKLARKHRQRAAR